MKFLINRDFREYLLHPDWLTLDESDLTKSIWKKFGSKTNYLENNFPNNWRIVIVLKNQIILEEKAIFLLKESLLNYFKSENNYINFISNTTTLSNTNRVTKRDKDLIWTFSHQLLFEAVIQTLAYLNVEMSEPQIDEFLVSNPEFSYKIPFIEPENIIPTNTQKNAWNLNSIQAFLHNNLLIQIKRTNLESEGIAIAIFIRKDLKLGKGKSGAQLSHGAISLLFQPIFSNPKIDEFIKSTDKTLLLFSVGDLKDLKEIEHMCITTKTNYSLITDAGHTQIAPGTITTCAVGPIPKIWLRILAFNIEASELN